MATKDRKATASRSAPPAALPEVESLIRLVRGEKVILDSELARLYGVETRVLLQAVRRNAGRFPPDFSFQLTDEEFHALRSQVVTSNRGGRRYAPFVFTEQGVAMLSSVLQSEQAIRVNIEIIRAFVRLRRIISENAALARRMGDLERKYDARFELVFDIIQKLMTPKLPDKQKGAIGFTSTKDQG